MEYTMEHTTKVWHIMEYHGIHYGISLKTLWNILWNIMEYPPTRLPRDSPTQATATRQRHPRRGTRLPQASQVSKLLQTSFTHLGFGAEYHGISLNVMECTMEYTMEHTTEYHGTSWNILWNIQWDAMEYHGISLKTLWSILWNVMDAIIVDHH